MIAISGKPAPWEYRHFVREWRPEIRKRKQGVRNHSRKIYLKALELIDKGRTAVDAAIATGVPARTIRGWIFERRHGISEPHA